MLARQLSWASASLLSVVTIYLGAVQVSSQVPRWTLIVVGVVVLIASVLAFPFNNSDDLPTRVVNKIRLSGPTFIAGDNSTQFHSTGKNASIHIDNRRDP